MFISFSGTPTIIYVHLGNATRGTVEFQGNSGVFRCRSATCGLSGGFFELFHYRCSFPREHQCLVWRYVSLPTGTNVARAIGVSTRQCSDPFQGHQQSYMSTAAMPPAAQTSFRVLQGVFRCRSATCGLSAGFFELFHYRCSFLREHQRLAWRYASFPTGTNAARTIGLSTRQCSYPFQGHQQSYMSTAAMPPAAQTSFKVLLGVFRCRSATCGLSGGFLELFHYRCSFLREHQCFVWRYVSLPTAQRMTKAAACSAVNCTNARSQHPDLVMKRADPHHHRVGRPDAAVLQSRHQQGQGRYHRAVVLTCRRTPTICHFLCDKAIAAQTRNLECSH